MSRHLDDDDEAVLPPRRSAEREMTLGTGAILGIFFGLVVLLGAFFGFGYKLGSSSTRTLAAANTGDAPNPDPSPAAAAGFNNFKPSAGSPAAAPSRSESSTVVVTAGSPPALVPPESSAGSSRTSPGHSDKDAPLPETASAHAPPAHTAPLAAPPAPASSATLPAVASGGSFYVQVSALSRQTDADFLIQDLRAKGITAFARTAPGDNYIHIQVGPFASKKDAEAMKARISEAGYNPILK